MKKIKKIIISSLIASSLSSPGIVFAQTQTSSQQSQIASIMSILSSLQSRLSSMLGEALSLSSSSSRQFAQVAGSTSAQTATLAISPSSKVVNIGDTVILNILLDTKGNSTDGVDINTLNYNPNILQLQDADAIVTGVQITPGTLYPDTLTNIADTTLGKISFSQVTAVNTTFTGQGILASVTFKAISAGTSPITFDFTLNKTTDTNVASAGADILASAIGGSVAVTAAVDAPATISTPAVSVLPNQAVVTFTTNEPTNSFIDYGPTTSYGNKTQTVNNAQNFSFTINSLSPDTTYNYRITANDTGGNSSKSNLLTFKTAGLPDTTAPSEITTLSIGSPTQTSLKLGWTAVGDDANVGQAKSYEIKYSVNSPSSTVADWWDGATMLTGAPVPKVSGGIESYTTISLTPGTTYYFAVKAVDDVLNKSSLSLSGIKSGTTLSATAPADTSAPSAVTNLSSSNVTSNSAKLTWIATGDDANVGTATTYDIRYSLSPITLANWASAIQIDGEPIPKVSGNSESMSIGSLNEKTTYYFGLKAIDDVSNISGLSNIITFTTIENTPPVDTTAPVISNVITSGITATSAVVAWDTDENTDSLVTYGTEEDSLTGSVAAVNLTNVHSLSLPNLSPSTGYFYQITSKDSSGNQSISDKKSFTTIAAVSATVQTSSGGGGGGGGGCGSCGIVADVTPPGKPAKFTARASNEQVSLSWENPKDSDFVRVSILRSENLISENTIYSSINQTADIVYNGVGEEYTDTVLQNGKTYYYAIYSYDSKPNYSAPVIVSAVPVAGKKAITITAVEVQEIALVSDKSVVSSTNVSNVKMNRVVTSTLRVDGPFSIGMTSPQVSVLQRMLSQDKTIYPEGAVSGFYGDLTKKAVETFQCKNMSLCSGSPESNGYGLAGPSTRDKINQLLGEVSVTQTINVESDEQKDLLIKSIIDQITQLQLLLKSLLEQLVEALRAEIAATS